MDIQAQSNQSATAVNSKAEKKFKTIEKSKISGQQSLPALRQKAQAMNLEFAEKGLPFKTELFTANGKTYIRIVSLPEQYTIEPAKVDE